MVKQFQEVRNNYIMKKTYFIFKLKHKDCKSYKLINENGKESTLFLLSDIQAEFIDLPFFTYSILYLPLSLLIFY